MTTPGAAESRAPRWRRTWRVLAVVVALAAAALVVRASTFFNQTFDEGVHLAAGLEWLQYGRYDLDPVHPPFARVFIALGPLAAGARVPGHGTSWIQGNDALLSGGRYARTLALARAGVLPFFLLLLAVVWAWARDLADDRAALLAVALAAATPPLLANAGVATNDMALAATLSWVFFAYGKWLEAPTARRTVLFALAGAAAIGSKLSSIPFFGLGAVLIVAARLVLASRARDDDPVPPARAYLRPLVGAALGIGLLVWAFYGFHITFAKGGWLPVPAPELLAGIRQLAHHDATGHPTYLLGRVSHTGWWYYFWVALAVKTPLPLLSLWAIALAWMLARRELRTDWRWLAPWLAAAAVMLVAMPSNIDIGIRHILPAFPLLIVPAAAAAVALWDRAASARHALVRATLAALVGWQGVNAIRTYPDFLASFNALAGPHPDRVLLDSNLDWGQDLNRLADTLHARRIGAVTLYYFGSTPVGAFRVADTVRIGGSEPATGWVAASRTLLHGVFASCVTWLDAYEPVARIGKSMVLYRVLPDTAAHVPRDAQPVASIDEQYGALQLGPAHRDDLCRTARVVIRGGHTALTGTTGSDTAGGAPAEAAAPLRAPAANVTDAMLLAADTATRDWLTNGHDYGNRRYSPLDQINAGNVQHLTLAWAAQVREPPGSQETTPIVANGVLYYTSPFGEVVAVDARTGVELWRYQHKLGAVATCCGAVNRGAALYHDRVYVSTLDAHILALDSRNGRLLWDASVADPDSAYSMTSAPLAVDGKIIVGVAGSEFGIRGHVDAYDAETGRLVWRFYTVPSPEQGGWWGRWTDTTPDGDHLPRDIAQEHRDSARYADAWKVGGGGVWNTPSYDPTLQTIYFGVGNPAPNMDGSVRPGDNLYTVSIVALDVKTGRLRWYYQEVPHDEWDYDATSPTVLFDVDENGTRVPAVAEAGKVGWLYILDRRTGARVRRSAEFVPHQNTFAAPTPAGTPIMPGMGGGANWTPPSYSPRTKLMYVGASVEPIRFVLSPERFEVGIKWQGGRHMPTAPPQGTLTAIDVATGKVRWQTWTRAPIVGTASLVTASDLLFYGERDGLLHAADARTGRVLWSIRVGGEMRAPPITYLVDGRQYIAVASGQTLFAFALP